MLKLCGIETEYNFVIGVPKSETEHQLPSQSELFRAVSAFLCESFGWTSGMVSTFLPNGGRFYLDMENAEWATPECRTLYDLVQYDLAGEMVLSKLHELKLRQLLGINSDAQIYVYKTNVAEQWAGNPATKRKTTGCHENYLVPASTRYIPEPDQFFLVLCKALIPFLVTRQVLCGSGKIGYDGVVPQINYDYQISQRSDFIDCISSYSTTAGRPIINLRDEPHADASRYRRLHLILGDANFSPWATFLKIGTTLLVINMVIDNFLSLTFELENPVSAIKAVSHDLSCKMPLAMKRGRRMNALEIQRAYLLQAKEYLSGQASAEDLSLVEIWKDTLDALEEPERNKKKLIGRLDWARKSFMLMYYHQRNDLAWTDPIMNIINLKYHIPRSGNSDSSNYEHNFETFPWPEPHPPACNPLRDPPADTRALLRGLAISAGLLEHASWSDLTFKKEHNRIPISDPLVFWHPEINHLVNPTVTIKHLRRSLRSPDKEAQATAIQRLQALGDKTAKLEVARAATDPDPKLRLVARQALDQMMRDD